MKTLAIANKISMYLLTMAGIVFCAGGTIAIIIDGGYFGLPLLLSLALALLSIPLTLFSLIQAYREKVISISYALLSILISTFLVGLGWFVIPFILNRDIKQYAHEADECSQPL